MIEQEEGIFDKGTSFLKKDVVSHNLIVSQKLRALTSKKWPLYRVVQGNVQIVDYTRDYCLGIFPCKVPHYRTVGSSTVQASTLPPESSSYSSLSFIRRDGTVVSLSEDSVMAYFDLSSYLYLSRLIHGTSLIIYELSVPPAHLHHVYIRTHARVNAYQTYLLSRYLAVNYLVSQRVFSHSTFLFCTHIPMLT